MTIPCRSMWFVAIWRLYDMCCGHFSLYHHRAEDVLSCSLGRCLSRWRGHGIFFVSLGDSLIADRKIAKKQWKTYPRSMKCEKIYQNDKININQQWIPNHFSISLSGRWNKANLWIRKQQHPFSGSSGMGGPSQNMLATFGSGVRVVGSQTDYDNHLPNLWFLRSNMLIFQGF